MGINHLVKVTSFLARPQDIPAYAKVRDKYLGDKRPATWLSCRRWLVQFISSRSRRPPRGTEPTAAGWSNIATYCNGLIAGSQRSRTLAH